MKTHYDNLQVSRNASQRVIRAAYKSLSQEWHPDKHPNDRANAERIMKIINRAYEVLSDPVSRVDHDKWIDAQTDEQKDRTEEQHSKKETYERYNSDKPSSQAPKNKQERSSPQRSLREEVLLGVKVISASFAIVAVIAATIFPAVETAGFAYNLGYFVGGLFDDREIGANKWVAWSLILAPYLIVRFRQPDSDSAAGQDSNDHNKRIFRVRVKTPKKSWSFYSDPKPLAQ